MDVSLFPSFDLRDASNKALSLQPEEERVMWQVSVIEGYVKDELGKDDISQATKSFMMASMLSRQRHATSDEERWAKVRDELRLTEGEIEDAQAELADLRIAYGFNNLLNRFIENWIPLVYVPATSDNGPIILKYRYQVPVIDDLRRISLKEGGLEYSILLENIFSAERDYFIIEPPDGTEFLPISEEKPVRICETGGGNRKLLVDCRMAFSKLVIRSKRKLVKEYDDGGQPLYDADGSIIQHWIPKRIPESCEEERNFRLIYRIFPKVKGLGLPFFIFWALSLFAIAMAMINPLANGESDQYSLALMQTILLLVPLFQFVRIDQKDMDFYRRILLRLPTKFCYAIAMLDIFALLLRGASDYVGSLSWCPELLSCLLAGLFIGVAISTILWYIWYSGLYKKHSRFIMKEDSEEFTVEVEAAEE
jgi:hypothetical protein